MWRAESLLVSIVRYRSASVSSNQLGWDDDWLQRHIKYAMETSSLLAKSSIGTHVITAQSVDTELENVKTMLATIGDKLPKGRLCTGIKCGDGTEVLWSELIALKNKSYSTVSRELVVGARLDVMIAIQGVRAGTVVGGTLKIDTPYSHVGIADDLLFEGEATYYPSDILMTIDGVTRPASLKEAWDPNHLEAIKIELAGVDKSIPGLLAASRRHMCMKKQPPVKPSEGPYLAIDTAEHPLDRYAAMEIAQLGLDEIMVAQKRASARLIAWCNTWQSRMKNDPSDKVTLGIILTEAARIAPLFRRYKLFVIRVKQLIEMRADLKNSIAKKLSSFETKTSYVETGTSDKNSIHLDTSVSAAMAVKDDDWLRKWLARDAFGDLSRLAHDGTVAPLEQSDVDFFTRDFDTLTKNMSIPQIWRLLSEDQRQRIRVHFPIGQETKTLEFDPTEGTVQPVVPVAQTIVKPHVTTKKKKGRKPKSASGEEDDDKLIQEALEQATRERMYNAKHGSLEAAKTSQCLISEPIKARASVNQTALMFASSGGHEQCVRKVLKAGGDPNQANNRGDTALTLAAQNGHEGCVLNLLKAGAAVDAANNAGVTALMLSASGGHEHVARALLKAGAAVDATNNEGVTALIKACKNGHDHVARAVLEAGADVNAANQVGMTSLITACENGHHLCASLLIQSGADVNKAQDNNNFTALMFACQNGHDLCARELIKAKADLDKQTLKGTTALMFAAKNGHDLCARALIMANASLESKNKDGFTALMICSQNGHDLCALDMIKAGANVNAAANNGFTSLMKACQNGHDRIARALLEAGAEIDKPGPQQFTALMFACSYGHEQCARAVLEAGAAVDKADSAGFTALIWTAQNGHDLCAREVLKAGANANKVGNQGQTALMLAAQNGHDLCARDLIKAGASLESKNKDGFTALMICSQNGHDLCARELIEAGANVDHANADGWTALMAAARNGHIGCMRLLLKNGADRNRKTRNGLTATEVAKKNNQTKATKLLDLISQGLAPY